MQCNASMQSLVSRAVASLQSSERARVAQRIAILPEGTSAMHVADSARQGFLSFVRGAGSKWGKRDIAQWLQGPYRDLTSHTASLVHGDDLDDSATFVRVQKRVSAVRLDNVLFAAKEEVLATLLMAAPPDSDVRFATRAMTAGHVARTRDAQGRGGWAPVDLPGMLLKDRVLSLVSVDYLMRPADYLALLSVCGICQAVSFDAQSRVSGQCSLHRPSLRKISVKR